MATYNVHCAHKLNLIAGAWVKRGLASAGSLSWTSKFQNALHNSLGVGTEELLGRAGWFGGVMKLNGYRVEGSPQYGAPIPWRLVWGCNEIEWVSCRGIPPVWGPHPLVIVQNHTCRKLASLDAISCRKMDHIKSSITQTDRYPRQGPAHRSPHETRVGHRRPRERTTRRAWAMHVTGTASPGVSTWRGGRAHGGWQARGTRCGYLAFHPGRAYGDWYTWLALKRRLLAFY